MQLILPDQPPAQETGCSPSYDLLLQQVIHSIANLVSHLRISFLWMAHQVVMNTMDYARVGFSAPLRLKPAIPTPLALVAPTAPDEEC
jgi:hypothetical protein